MRQTGGKGQYGHAVITLEPLEQEAATSSNRRSSGAPYPREFWKAVEEESATRWPAASSRATRSSTRRQPSSMAHSTVDSSEMAFKIAGSMAAKAAVAKADPVILEPVMKVEVVTPEDFMGDVIGNLNARRGSVDGIEERATSRVIAAHVPLAEMFGYATDLRSMTRGQATVRWSSPGTRKSRSPSPTS